MYHLHVYYITNGFLTDNSYKQWRFLFANQLRHGIIAIGRFRQNRMDWLRQPQFNVVGQARLFGFAQNDLSSID